MAKKKPVISLLIQGKDCYDPEDYLLVHKDRYAALVKREIAELDKVYVASLERLLGRLVDACEFNNGTWIYKEAIQDAKMVLNRPSVIVES